MPSDKIEVRVLDIGNARTSFVVMKKREIIADHQHENENIDYLTRGKIKFYLGEDKKEVIYSAIEIYIIPLNTRHGGAILENVEIIDFNFYS